MADNATFGAGNNATLPDTTKVAADEASYSGDTALVQLVRPAYVSGSEGAKTANPADVGAGNVGSGTPRMTLADDDPAVAVLGDTTGAAVVTDADGTIQRYLRGIVKLLITTGTIVLGAGTAAIGKLAANSGVDIGDVDVTSITGVTMSNAAMQTTGDEAHDDADAGNPMKIGAKAIAHGSNPTAVAANDRTNLYANRAGIPFHIGGHPNIVTVEAAYTAAQTDTAIVTVSTGTIIVVTAIALTLDEATTVGVGCRVGFGTANTPTTTGVVATHPGLVPGGGIVQGDGSGILGIGADNEDLRITSEVPTGGSLRVKVTYFTIES